MIRIKYSKNFLNEGIDCKYILDIIFHKRGLLLTWKNKKPYTICKRKYIKFTSVFPFIIIYANATKTLPKE